MSVYQEKHTKHTKRHKAQLEGTGQVPELDMAEMLELLDWEFKTIMINMLWGLVD